MLRRNPTLIPMNDFDVQDARDMLAKEVAEAQQQQLILQKLKQLAEKQNMDGDDVEAINQLKAANAKLEKARRLGIQPESSKP